MEVSAPFVIKVSFMLFNIKGNKHAIMQKIFLVSLIFLSLGLPACYRDAPSREITDIQHVSPEQRVTPPVLTTAERFGLENAASSDPNETTLSSIDNVASGETGSKPNRIAWTPPPTWTQGESRPMRLATFFPANEKNVECSVIVLSGEAGGIEPNLNRWRGQMELSPLSSDELARLATFDLLDSQATYMECTGTLPTGEAWALLGLICPLANETIFVKMTGPAASVIPEKEHFMAFVRSFHFEEDPIP